jgi:hypothetical protein
MTQPSGSSAQLDRDTIEYGPISGWAFVAVFLGLLSGAAVAGPILWFIPLVAVVISLIAMRKIAASAGQLSGWKLALLGLLAAVFFGIAGPARTFSRQYYLQARAVRFGEKFIDLLEQNQPLTAFQCTLSPGLRKPLSADESDVFAKTPDRKAAYETFLKIPSVKALLDAGPRAKVNLLSARYVGSSEIEDAVAINYQIATPDDGGKSTVVQLDAIRMISNGSTEQWRIIPPASTETSDR